jgi:type I restriction enzyme S subunit
VLFRSASASIGSEYIVNDGDILFSWSGSLECVIWFGGAGALNQHLFKVTSDKYSKWFLYMWIHHHLPEFRHIAAGKATTMGHIQRHHLKDAKVLVPAIDLLFYQDKIMEPLIDAIISRSLENRKLAALRDTLLPQLISGELRVKDAERIAGRSV